MMCSKLLRRSGDNRLTHKLDQAFEWLSNRYQNLLRASLRAPWAAVVVSVAIGFGAYLLLQKIPREYAPQEDRGQFNASLQAPEGTSYARLQESAQKVESYLQPYFDDGTIQRGVVSVPGFQPGQSGNVNVTLKPWGERKIATTDLLAILNKGWEDIPDMRITAFVNNGNRGGGGGGGGQPVQIVLGGSNYEELARWRDIIIAGGAANPGLTRLDSDLRETQPQVLVRVDTDRAASLGVSARSIGSTLQTLMSERQITTYVVDGEEYDVVLMAEPKQRATYADLSNIFVRSERSGDLIPLSNLTKLEDMAGPSQLNRHNRMRAVTITANLVNGYTLGEALTWLEDLIHKDLPATAQISYRGESLDYKEASGALYFTFGIALFVVFLVLAAQFESFIHPLVIMVTVPLAVAGGLLGLAITGKTLNIYSQIGIIMLVGIAAKNGVLIVEFINQLRDRGMEFKEAIVEASRIRLRPVVMTAFSAVMGSVPLILAHGPGSVSRQALGVVIFSGVSLATLFTLFIVPSVYNLLARHTGSPNAIAHRLATMRTEVSPG